MRGKFRIYAFSFAVLCLVYGFAITLPGVFNADLGEYRWLSIWLIKKYVNFFVATKPTPIPDLLQWYSPLPNLIIGVLEFPLAKILNDWGWVRTAFTAALLPFSFGVLAYRLRELKVPSLTIAFILALSLGCVRAMGNSLQNFSDFPSFCVFTLAAIELFVLFSKPLSEFIRPTNLFLASFWAVVPFLTRPPLALHLAGLAFVCAERAIFPRESKDVRTRLRVLAPIFLSPILIFLLYPRLWQEGFFSGLAKCFTIFESYPFEFEVLYWGIHGTSHHLPRWYVPSWFPVAIEPFTLIAFLSGLGFFAFRVLFKKAWGARLDEPGFRIQGLGRIGLREWILAFGLLPLFVFIVLNPANLDEDRHVIFLYWPFAIFTGLVLAPGMTSRLRTGVSILIVASSLYAYASWQRYSYAYVSPLIAHLTEPEDFMGDYYGLCMSKGIHWALTRLPTGSGVAMNGPEEPIGLQYDHLTENRLIRNRFPTRLVLRERKEVPKSRYILTDYRLGRGDTFRADIVAGKAKILFEDQLPTGRPACTLLEYPERENAEEI
jgi:hypothetical protein